MAQEDNSDDWSYPRGHTYQPYMVEFMSFLHGAVEYNDDHVFTKEALLEIKPIDVKRFLCMKAYGDPDPNIAAGARPVQEVCMVHDGGAYKTGRYTQFRH